MRMIPAGRFPIDRDFLPTTPGTSQDLSGDRARRPQPVYSGLFKRLATPGSARSIFGTKRYPSGFRKTSWKRSSAAEIAVPGLSVDRGVHRHPRVVASHSV